MRSIYHLGFWTSQVRLVDPISWQGRTVVVDGQLDCSIMSTPGGVVEDLWAECSGYRTLEGENVLAQFVLPQHQRENLPVLKNHQTFSAHVGQSELSDQQNQWHKSKNDDLNRNRVCQQYFLHRFTIDVPSKAQLVETWTTTVSNHNYKIKAVYNKWDSRLTHPALACCCCLLWRQQMEGRLERSSHSQTHLHIIKCNKKDRLMGWKYSWNNSGVYATHNSSQLHYKADFKMSSLEWYRIMWENIKKNMKSRRQKTCLTRQYRINIQDS